MFSWFTIWAADLRSRQGWRSYRASLLYGALAALSFPPFNAFFALWFCFPAVIFLLQGATSWRAAFATGWFFSFGMLTISLYWIAGSLFVDIKQFWWLVPFAVAGLPALLALYYAVATLVGWYWGLKRYDGVLFLALSWFLADYARGHLFTGFPWDLVGHAWADILPVLQITSVIGIYGLSLVTLLLIVLPATLVAPVRTRYSTQIFIISLLFLAGLFGWGHWRLTNASDAVVADVRLRLVQSDLQQSHKWRSEERERNFQQLLNVTFAPAKKPITHIIWPETATALYLTEDKQHRKIIAARMPKGAGLLTGVVRRGVRPDGSLVYFNSLIALNDRGNVVAGYDKVHLVPFGEYIPFRSFIPIPAIATLGTDFTAGEGLYTMRVPGLPPFSPLVCYEVIFPDKVIEVGDTPQFMVNVTNDGWYEHTTGPYQHFAIARVRTIEEGMPLVRVANKGVVAVIDAYGRSKAQFGWGWAGFVDSDLPQPVAGLTFYSHHRNMILWILLGAVSVFICMLRFLITSRIR